MSAGPILFLVVLLTGYIYFSAAQSPDHMRDTLCAHHHRNPKVCQYEEIAGPCGSTCPKGEGGSCGTSLQGVIKRGICAEGLKCFEGFCRPKDVLMPKPGNLIAKKSYGARNQIPLPLFYYYQQRYNRYDYYDGSEPKQYDMWEQLNY